MEYMSPTLFYSVCSYDFQMLISFFLYLKNVKILLTKVYVIDDIIETIIPSGYSLRMKKFQDKVTNNTVKPPRKLILIHFFCCLFISVSTFFNLINKTITAKKSEYLIF